jgi:cytidylate kinase
LYPLTVFICFAPQTIKYLSRCEAFHFANIERMKHVKNIYAMLQGNSQRDEDDRRRYSLLYGEHPELDYQNEDIYDYVIDTTKNEAGETFEQACDLLSDVLKSKQAP